jgi:hypothetical protein
MHSGVHMLGLKLQEKVIAGETVFIRNLNGSSEAIHAIELTGKVSGEPTLMAEIGALLVVCCLCDKEGNQLYNDAYEVRKLASFAFLSEFATAALELSGLTGSEEVIKNSEADQ